MKSGSDWAPHNVLSSYPVMWVNQKKDRENPAALWVGREASSAGIRVNHAPHFRVLKSFMLISMCSVGGCVYWVSSLVSFLSKAKLTSETFLWR